MDPWYTIKDVNFQRGCHICKDQFISESYLLLEIVFPVQSHRILKSRYWLGLRPDQSILTEAGTGTEIFYPISDF